MTTRFTAIFPVTATLGPFKQVVTETSYETKEQNALWHYNKAREHDGYKPLKQLPQGTCFRPIETD